MEDTVLVLSCEEDRTLALVERSRSLSSAIPRLRLRDCTSVALLALSGATLPLRLRDCAPTALPARLMGVNICRPVGVYMYRHTYTSCGASHGRT